MYGILRDVFSIGIELCFDVAYTKWFVEADVEFNRNALIYALQDRPEGLFRMKGFVRAATTFPNDIETGLVAIGLA